MSRSNAEEWTAAQGQLFAGIGETFDAAQRFLALGIAEGKHRELGLTVEEWRDRCLGPLRLRREERAQAVAELTAPPDEGGLGLSNRKAADVLGVAEGTVRNDRRAQDYAPDEPEPLLHDEPAAQDYAPPPRAHVANNSGDDEWYSPGPYAKAGGRVMGGIDLDPASSEAANEVIEATRFYTIEDDGLTQPWAGRLWMNPPYSQPWIDRFCTRLAREYAAGTVSQACALVNNATETNWFQEMVAQASAVCFPRGRVRFWHPTKPSAAPLQGQAVVYLGTDPDCFADEFRRFGFVGVRT